MPSHAWHSPAGSLLLLLLLLAALFTPLALAAVAAPQDRTVDIFAWPASARAPSPLARVAYTPLNASVVTLSPPPVLAADDDFVRVGFYRAGGSSGSGSEWAGVATAASLFTSQPQGGSKRTTAPLPPLLLQLLVRADGELCHVGISRAGSDPVSSLAEGRSGVGAGGGDNGGHARLAVEVRPVLPGPAPHLNRPVVVSADGRLDDREPEKTFFQKYWWAIALFIVMQVVAGGGGAKE